MKHTNKTSRRGIRLGAFLGSLALFGAAEVSAAEVITFDTTPIGVPTTPGQVITNEYFSQGLLLVSGGTVTDDGSGPALGGTSTLSFAPNVSQAIVEAKAFGVGAEIT